MDETKPSRINGWSLYLEALTFYVFKRVKPADFGPRNILPRNILIWNFVQKWNLRFKK